MVQEITGEAFKGMIINASAAIEQNKRQLNELNVFPVPDGDTGTNMCLTMASGVAELRKASPASVAASGDIAANALLRGARGNSGVILSLLFRGMSKSLKGKTTANSLEFANAMSDGVAAAYKAVMKPTEGTILTVSRLASAAAVEAAEGGEADIISILETAIKAGGAALDDTINQNPVLKKAGVVDAGGKGYMYILKGMLLALQGEMLQVEDNGAAVSEKADFASFETEDIKFAYCTEFIVQKDNMKSPEVLGDFLSGIGDSMVLVDDDEIIKVHIHTNAPGSVLTEALTYGPLITVKVENMKLQHSGIISDAHNNEDEKKHYVAEPEKKYGVVAVCAGEGMQGVFKELGVDGIITGGQTMNPSTDDILKEIDRTPAEIVFVLPNNKNIIMAAQQCIPLSEKKVVVIPTKTVPQGVSAMLSFDPSTEEEECEASLCEAIKSVHTVQITYAARDSEFDGHSIKEGEYLALLESSLIANDADFSVIMDKVSGALAQFDPEFITLFYGQDVSESEANTALEMLSSVLSEAETTLVSGGQPVYYYMISAE